MSKETVLILLGLFVMALRTLLGLPGTWQTAALVLAGGAVAMIGFLLRGESLARGKHHRQDSFAEAQPIRPTTHQHGKEDGIGSLN
jgi:hypothetical protein